MSYSKVVGDVWLMKFVILSETIRSLANEL